MKTCLYSLLIMVFCHSLSARTWIDSQGRSMEADFVGTMDKGSETIVIFSKSDGMRYQVPLNKLSADDQAFIKSGKASREKSNAVAATAQANPKPLTPFEEDIRKNLVQQNGSNLKRVSPDSIPAKEYYAIYYSASWCPPCRKFTPELVKFYNKMQQKNKGDKFELIYVSSDRSEDAMESYIKDYDMPWPALDFDRISSSRELTQFRGSGIPCLVLVDKQGNVLSNSYVNGRYVGPTKVMNDLEAKL